MERGQTIGPYELEAQVGEGATAEVWSAMHRSLGVRRALKFLTHTGKEARRRLIYEAQVQARVRHPNVVCVHDVFLHDDAPVIVMDLVQGETLEAWSQKERTPEAIHRVLCEALAGLAAIHAAGLIHRDIKPSNILVDGNRRVVISDLGLAREPEGSGTRTGALMGTPAYMAPEQTDDATAATAQSDLFAMGLVALTLITGNAVFQRDTVRKTLLAIHDCEDIVEGLVLPDEPRLSAVVRFVRAVVRYQPEDRPASASACLALLGAQETLLPALVEPKAANTPPPPVLGAIGAAAGGALTAASVMIFLVGFGIASWYAEPTADARSVYRTEPIEELATGGTVGPPERRVELARSADTKKGFLGGIFKKK